ncbi:MAG: hypothetical protein METHAR1v1_1280011 [Methanothrix sp.]|nr:MAG: hypothetical protein METHAR1v1_1280011 [Methanothrix sp.]
MKHTVMAPRNRFNGADRMELYLNEPLHGNKSRRTRFLRETFKILILFILNPHMQFSAKRPSLMLLYKSFSSMIEIVIHWMSLVSFTYL